MYYPIVIRKARKRVRLNAWNYRLSVEGTRSGKLAAQRRLVEPASTHAFDSVASTWILISFN